MPNCSSHSGRQSTFAPESSKTVGPLSAGQTVAIAGREMPSIVRSLISAMARNAPLLPAETTASASPCLTRFTATPSEVRSHERRPRRATRSIAIASGACTTRTRSAPGPRRSGRTRASSPTSRISASNSCAASSAPATVSSGAWSPPIASTAMRPLRAPRPAASLGATLRILASRQHFGLARPSRRHGTICRLWRSAAKFVAKDQRPATTSVTQ